jgi:hypothetical protein
MPNATQPKTIQQMQADLAAFRAAKLGGGSPAATTTAPVEAPAVPDNPIARDLAEYRQQKAAGTLPKPDVSQGSNPVVDLAKGLFSAPATIAARPFQAAADVGDYIGTRIEENRARTAGDQAGAAAIMQDEAARQREKQTTSTGPLGLIAPTPKDMKDVKKDVGRAIQTVALGTGAPLSGGALFGVGTSLEEGNDLASAQTAVDAVLGAGGAKVLGWVGKPLLGRTGKVIGVITPKIIKDVAAQGAGALEKFMAAHELLPAVAKKPIAAFERGMQATDAAINQGVSAVSRGTKTVLKDQFPQLDPTEHFKNVNKNDLLKPTTINKPAYSAATDIYKEAQRRGIDIGEHANELGIAHHELADGRAYNTEDTAKLLNTENITKTKEVIRPALKVLDHEVPWVPVSEVRANVIAKIRAMSPSTISDSERTALINRAMRVYSDTSAAAKAHPHGYNLTDMFDSRIEAGTRGKYRYGVTPGPDVTSAKFARAEESTFRDLFDSKVPKNSGLTEVRKEFEKNKLLADYLEALHNKRVPQSVVGRAVELFGRGVGGAVGGNVGGFSGFLVGSRLGDMMFKNFELLDNPIKANILRTAFKNRMESPVYNMLRKKIGDVEAERLMRLRLPAPGQTSYKEPPLTAVPDPVRKLTTYHSNPEISVTPNGVAALDKKEAADIAAVEMGKAKPPKTDRRLSSYQKKVRDARDAGMFYSPEGTIPMGKKPKAPKRLNDIY